VEFLLDTVAFLWIGEGGSRLSATARAIVTDPHNPLTLSAVSAWEIHVKASIGKLPLPIDPTAYIRRVRAAYDISTLDFTEEDASGLAGLPFHHRDPYDRALVSQAASRALVILTPDRAFAAYGVATAW
jgi:PIN domain nuclease of toxin-antitoxin system